MKKIKSNSIVPVLIMITASLFVGCTGKQNDHGHDQHEGHQAEGHAPGNDVMEASQPQFQVDDKFQDQLASVFTSYVQLKDAFVNSDMKNVQAKASETKEVLGKVDMKLLSGAAHNDWMAFLTPIQSALTEIESGGDIETQRKAFSTLSDNLYKSIKAFGLGGEEAYYEYCPMAFNDEGAYWLSDKPEIKNPYYGEKMLSCGEVKEKLM